jgi:hypothetical protein
MKPTTEHKGNPAKRCSSSTAAHQFNRTRLAERLTGKVQVQRP